MLLTFNEIHIDSCVRVMSHDVTSPLSAGVLKHIIEMLTEMAIDDYQKQKRFVEVIWNK